jgi:hypothetical protein
VQIVRSLSSMFALSDDSTNGDYASSVGNLDLEWRRAMDDLRRQEAEEMICGTYSKYSVRSLLYYPVVMIPTLKYLLSRLWVSAN